MEDIVPQIICSLRERYAALNLDYLHYEAGWSDSFVHQRCWYAHRSLVTRRDAGCRVDADDMSSRLNLATHES